MEYLQVFRRLNLALSNCDFPSFYFKPKQIECFEYLLEGSDVIAVLPTGFGKSILFQLLPDFLPVKSESNIVIVACPLNSIIENQVFVLNERGIPADILRVKRENVNNERLFEQEHSDDMM